MCVFLAYLLQELIFSHPKLFIIFMIGISPNREPPNIKSEVSFSSILCPCNSISMNRNSDASSLSLSLSLYVCVCVCFMCVPALRVDFHLKLFITFTKKKKLFITFLISTSPNKKPPNSNFSHSLYNFEKRRGRGSGNASHSRLGERVIV